MKAFTLFISLLLLPFFLVAQEEEFKHWRIATMGVFNFNNTSSPFSRVNDNYLAVSFGIQGAHRFTKRLEMEIGLGFSERLENFTVTGCPPTFPCIILGDFRHNRILKYFDISVVGNYYFKRFEKLNLFAATGLLHSFLRGDNHSDLSIPRFKKTIINPIFRMGMEYNISHWLQLRYHSSYLPKSRAKTEDTNNGKTSTVQASLGLAISF